ncbi:peptidoglycan-binding protein [Streptomyces sp. NPDC059080]|uniref:peptidoglycan-binding domain-containing protein n=1 Tax=Streptomyces sp. NPDC059080 TaxID=3346718 RepID=UPI0036B86CE3
MSTFRIPLPRIRRRSGRALKRVAVLAVAAGALTTGLSVGPAFAAMGDNLVDTPAACAFYEGRQTAAFGDQGDRVSQIQCLLANRKYLGWNRLSGHFDAPTLVAVVNFQRNYGLVPDGAVTPETWNALYHAGTYAA